MGIKVKYQNVSFVGYVVRSSHPLFYRRLVRQQRWALSPGSQLPVLPRDAVSPPAVRLVNASIKLINYGRRGRWQVATFLYHHRGSR